MSELVEAGVPVMLKQILQGLVESPDPLLEIRITGLALDSRRVQRGDLFLAVSGSREHGLCHADDACARGAAAIAYEPEGVDPKILAALQDRGPALVAVPGLQHCLGEIAGRFHDFPSRAVEVIGVTGTNGKTSCSHFLAQALSGFAPCGVIGTLGWGCPGALEPLPNTTPDPVLLTRIMSSFRQDSVPYVAMEASSHGLVQGRTRGTWFRGVAFTNITRDHLDYHKTMRVYIAAKLSLLKADGVEFVVINLDDKHADQILAAVPANVRIMGFTRGDNAQSPFANLKLTALRHDDRGVEFQVRFENRSVPVSAPVFCDFNVENLLTVLAIMLELGFELDAAVSALQNLKPVPGRLERFATPGETPTVIVDYAHTPHALQSILEGLRKHCSGDLWVVFGCGGDRDRGKRPIMGRIAETASDHVLITDDNPRSEDGGAIISEILRGCEDQSITVIRDRAVAIRTAIDNAKTRDLVVIAGKGHEATQEIAGVKHPFDDRLVVADVLSRRMAASCSGARSC